MCKPRVQRKLVPTIQRRLSEAQYWISVRLSEALHRLNPMQYYIGFKRCRASDKCDVLRLRTNATGCSFGQTLLDDCAADCHRSRGFGQTELWRLSEAAGRASRVIATNESGGMIRQRLSEAAQCASIGCSANAFQRSSGVCPKPSIGSLCVCPKPCTA